MDNEIGERTNGKTTKTKACYINWFPARRHGKPKQIKWIYCGLCGCMAILPLTRTERRGRRRKSRNCGWRNIRCGALFNEVARGASSPFDERWLQQAADQHDRRSDVDDLLRSSNARRCSIGRANTRPRPTANATDWDCREAPAAGDQWLLCTRSGHASNRHTRGFGFSIWRTLCGAKLRHAGCARHRNYASQHYGIVDHPVVATTASRAATSPDFTCFGRDR